MVPCNMPLPSSSGGTDYDQYKFQQIQKMQQANADNKSGQPAAGPAGKAQGNDNLANQRTTFGNAPN